MRKDPGHPFQKCVWDAQVSCKTIIRFWEKQVFGQVNLANSALNKSKQRIVGFLKDFER